MPRPKKCRRISGGMPEFTRFGPKGKRNNSAIVMTIDEYETLRLIDYENLMQEEAAKKLNVARTTTQAIYAVARKKVSTALVEGKDIIIEGGDIELYPPCHNKQHHNRCGKNHLSEFDIENK